MTRITVIPKSTGPMLLAALAALAFASAPASAQSNCKWYGATALKQQQSNEQLKCGFTGPEWHSDMSRHSAWCAQVPPDVWKTAARNRDQMLAKCASKAK